MLLSPCCSATWAEVQTCRSQGTSLRQLSQATLTTAAVVQDHMAEVLRPGLAVRTYQDGECLIRQGEQSTHLFYIDQGQVEVLLRLPPSRDAATPERRCAAVALASFVCLVSQLCCQRNARRACATMITAR